MKTPREILFERHRQAEPRLEAIRRKTLASLPAAGSTEARQPGRGEARLIWPVLRTAWLELIWPSRRAWAGMAALWLAVLAANLQMKATSGSGPAVRSAPAGQLVQAVEEQRRILSELLPSVQPPPIQNPRPAVRPRTERPVFSQAC